MAALDILYYDIFRKILAEGKQYYNLNRQTQRLQIPSYTLRHSFEHGFPAITTKKLNFKAVVVELLWFLRGDNDISFLNKHGIKIWNQDAYNWHLKNGGALSFQEFSKQGVGSTGRNYSKQWRDFNGKTDQLVKVIEHARKDIMSNRLRVSAWNPSELDQTALPPCHTDFQIIGVPLYKNHYGFELHWTQRSTDAFLGLPFDIATYGLLAKIIEKQTGYKALAIEGNLKCVHLYENQIEAAEKLLKRSPFKHSGPTLQMPTLYRTDLNLAFNSYQPSDFKLINYTCDSQIKVEMLAPKL